MVTQKANTSSQDIIPDIDSYYNKIIKEIDRFRSRRNSSSTIGIFQNISESKLDIILATSEMNSIFPQESRCNTFYRMIGFPVISSNGELYSPGFNPDVNKDIVERQRQLTIANGLLTSVGSTLNSRELYPKDSTVLFQQQDTIASAKAISSTFVRNFGRQFKNGLGPLDKDPQIFQIQDRASVANDFDTTIESSLLTSSTHILKPFVGDPRIELTVAPAANRICAPFLTDKSKTQLSKGQYLKRPYIEKVLRVRINEANILMPPSGQSDSGQYLRDLITSIKNNPNITDPSVTDILANPLQSLHKSEIVIFEKFIRILQSFISELVKSVNQIGQIRTVINWKPIPNVNGPEFGSELNIPDRTDTVHNHKIENDINQAELVKIIGQTDFDVGTSTVDIGDFIFSDIDDAVLTTTQHNYDFYDKQLSQLNRQRNEAGAKANDLLRKIEVITGEFSGLGLIDIIAIQAALWIIEPKDLLGLIDKPAITRMQTDNSLKTNISPSNSVAALTAFEKKLSGIYILIDSFYQNIIDANGVNNQ